jgi:hypothetical protein
MTERALLKEQGTFCQSKLSAQHHDNEPKANIIIDLITKGEEQMHKLLSNAHNDIFFPCLSAILQVSKAISQEMQW